MKQDLQEIITTRDTSNVNVYVMKQKLQDFMAPELISDGESDSDTDLDSDDEELEVSISLQILYYGIFNP